MPKSFDVCIRGDGVVGRTLALLLARERLRVALVGAFSVAAGAPAAEDVRAYALNSASRQLLQGLRAWPHERYCEPVRDMQVWGDEGARVDFSARGLNDGALAWIVDGPALEQQLQQALHFQTQVERVAEPVKAGLQVACDGQHGSSRDAFGASWSVTPYPQKAIAARLLSDRPHHGVARQWFHGGEVIALLPMAALLPATPPARAERPADHVASDLASDLALVWSADSAHADVLLLLDEAGFAAAVQSVCGEVAGQLKLTSPRQSWPLALALAERWVGPGWALAGDAAHTIHPLAGQGLNLGLGDAKLLAEVLAQREYWREPGDERLLRRYERGRKAQVAAMAAVTDGLQGVFGHTDSRWQSLREWGMKGFARSAPLKAWVVRQASGV